jgi:hypothetical protein
MNKNAVPPTNARQSFDAQPNISHGIAATPHIPVVRAKRLLVFQSHQIMTMVSHSDQTTAMLFDRHGIQ